MTAQSSTSAIPAPARAGSDFAPLVRAVRAAGLLRPRRLHYAMTIAIDLALFVAIWVAVLEVGATWWVLFLALPAAIVSTRIVFVGHDAGHRQVARTARVNRLLSLAVGDVISGLAAHWWVDKHSRHHANPNEVGRDPDVAPGFPAWTPEQAEGRGRFGTWCTRHQHILYFPLLLLEAFNLRVGSLRAAHRPRDLVLWVVHVSAYVGLLVVGLGPGRAAVFIVVHQAMFGVHLGCAFAPNHKGMPMPPPGARWDFLSKQVLTSRNVSGGWVVDWLLGGLNHQIEHHLFPSMPRANLRRARSHVRAYCVLMGLPYTEESLPSSLVLMLRHLRTAGAGLPVAAMPVAVQ